MLCIIPVVTIAKAMHTRLCSVELWLCMYLYRQNAYFSDFNIGCMCLNLVFSQM